MKRLLIVILVLVCSCSFAQIRGGAQYDPAAARRDLSNVSGAASLELSQRVRAAWAEITGNIYASGSARLEAGTAAAPAYSFASDPNTGMYSPGADTIGFGVGAAEAFRVNSAGEVLIATSTDAGDYKLQVNGNTYIAGRIRASIPAGNSVGTYAGSFINNSAVNSSQHGLAVSVAGNGGNVCEFTASGTTRFKISNSGVVTLLVQQVYADNAAALAGGLTAGMLYRTSTGQLMIVY